jgi:hypothetical protein
MQYKDMNLDIVAGDVILFHTDFVWYNPRTYLSLAVRSFTQFPYNHCGVIVENNGELFINEALAGGVMARPLYKHLDRGDAICVLRPKRKIDAIPFSQRANDELGIDYNFKGLVLDNVVYRLPMLIWGKPGPWTGHTAQFATSKMVCSQYVSWAHALPRWWENSSREVYTSGAFDIVYEERSLLK